MATPVSRHQARRRRFAPRAEGVSKGFTAPFASVRAGSGTTRSQSIPVARPNPWQVAHAPSGLLNEKRFGVGGAKPLSHQGHERPSENRRSCAGSPSRAGRWNAARPPPARNAVSSESTTRARAVRPVTRRSTTTNARARPSRFAPSGARSSTTRSATTRPAPPGSSAGPGTRMRVNPASWRSWTASTGLRPGPSGRSKPTTTRRPGGSASKASAARSGVSASTARPHPGHVSRATFAKRSFRWSRSSDIVPTVDRLPRTGRVRSIATAGGIPSTWSTSGRSMRSRNWRA